ncbi:MAG: hypothetical protein SFV54_07140 [Bryobacteraceae bacterium]|nr:hypothetical protein [Bryobacteraceae bacterium]
MAVRVRVRNGQQIIVPIRFTRAVTGAPSPTAPHIDDRGFAMGVRPGTWGSSTARGAMCSLAAGDRIRVKVLREDIDAGTPLFVTSTKPSVVAVSAPAHGSPLPGDGIFEIEGLVDRANDPVAIEVHLGSADGPVIGELEPHIFQLRTLRVRVHLVTINGVSTTRTAQSMVDTFRQINEIWRPAGIVFEYDPALVRTPALNGFAVAGQMTTNISGGNWNEFSTIINTNPDNFRINLYCVRDANEVHGLTFDNRTARPNGYGIVLADSGTANSNAHELCHYLDNPHHSWEDAAQARNRADIWARRRLLWSPDPWDPEALAHRNDVGYGNTRRGALITVKEMAGDPWDGELARARRRSLNPY